MKIRSILVSGMLALAMIATATIAVPAMLTGCPAIDVRAPQTFNERAVAGYQTISGATDIVSTLLAAGTIDAADARNAHDSLTLAKQAIDIASAIAASGDLATAEGRLNATLTGLNALDTYLRSKT